MDNDLNTSKMEATESDETNLIDEDLIIRKGTNDSSDNSPEKFTFAHIGPYLDDPNSLFHHFHSCFEQFVGYTFSKAELEAYKKGGQFIPGKQPQLLKDILGAVL